MSPVLLLIDVQGNMLHSPQPVPGAIGVSRAISELLARARAAGLPVVHVRNNGKDTDPDAPGTPGWELVHQPVEGELVIDKAQPDAFAATGLGDVLAEGVPLVVAGMQSEFCIRETILSALRRGHPVTLVRGAHATYDAGQTPAAVTAERIERELRDAGACVVTPKEVQFPAVRAS